MVVAVILITGSRYPPTVVELANDFRREVRPERNHHVQTQRKDRVKVVHYSDLVSFKVIEVGRPTNRRRMCDSTSS